MPVVYDDMDCGEIVLFYTEGVNGMEINQYIHKVLGSIHVETTIELLHESNPSLDLKSTSVHIPGNSIFYKSFITDMNFRILEDTSHVLLDYLLVFIVLEVRVSVCCNKVWEMTPKELQ